MSENNPAAQSLPRFSVLVAVYHSLAYLAECLTSLARLDYPRQDYEVIVLDLDTIEGLADFVKGLQSDGLRIKLFHPPDQTRPESSLVREVHLNRARNLAVKAFPARVYVFTEDDCTFEPDWLIKFDAALADGIGSIGGPDLLPPDMGLLETVLDCILNAPLGRVGAKAVEGKANVWYHPHKENMAVPAGVFTRVGPFQEGRVFGVETEFARRVREAGLKTVYLADNPVWHKRVTTFSRLLQRNFYMAEEKIHLMREKGSFLKSLHFVVLMMALMMALIGLGALVSSVGRFLFLLSLAGYFSFLLAISVLSAIRTGRITVAIGVFFFTPIHQISILAGIFKGVMTRPRPAGATGAPVLSKGADVD